MYNLFMVDEQRIPNDFTDTEYQTLKMQDFDNRRNSPLLVQIDYLREMFDLSVENSRDKQIVITLTEKRSHFAERQGRG